MKFGNTHNKSKFIRRDGFTIVEIITVLFIVSVGLIGVLSLIVRNIQSQTYNKHNLIAYQLAQEGIELIREVRDTNWKNSLDYDYNLADGTYDMDYLSAAPITATSSQPLYLSSDGYYSHDDSGTYSGFRRLITIHAETAHSLQVICTVGWAIGNQSYTYSLETILYDWK